LTIIFTLTKYRKMPKSFSRNHFTPKTNGALVNYLTVQ
jgi:hypothetical protein